MTTQQQEKVRAEIKINGASQFIVLPCSIDSLLKDLDVRSSYVAVAVNHTCISRRDFSTTLIKPDDAIEILKPMAGG